MNRETARIDGLHLDGLVWGVGTWQSQPLHLHLPPGQTLALLGHNGAGKTALLDTLAGFLPARAGRIGLGGRELTTLPPEQRRIGYMFQTDALLPHWNIERNLRLGRGARADLRPLLDALGLRPWLHLYPHQLSGGQRQRVALARALVGGPDLLLLDEPFSAIDPEARPALRQTLADLLRASAVTTVLVTHDARDAQLLGDQVGVLDHGRLLQSGATQAVFDRPSDLRSARLLGVDNLWPMHVLPATAAQPSQTVCLGHGGCPVLDGLLPPAGVTLRAADRVIVAVRAEHLQPLPAAASPAAEGVLTLRATLTAARLEGPLWRLHCALDCGLTAQAYALPAQWRDLALSVGAPLALALRRQDVHLLV